MVTPGGSGKTFVIHPSVFQTWCERKRRYIKLWIRRLTVSIPGSTDTAEVCSWLKANVFTPFEIGGHGRLQPAPFLPLLPCCARLCSFNRWRLRCPSTTLSFFVLGPWARSEETLPYAAPLRWVAWKRDVENEAPTVALAGLTCCLASRPPAWQPPSRNALQVPSACSGSNPPPPASPLDCCCPSVVRASASFLGKSAEGEGRLGPPDQ